MLNSVSNRFQNGFGNDSGELGHNIMDLHLSVGAGAAVEGFESPCYFGRRANGFYIPRYRNSSDKRDYLRGFGYQGGASRQGWSSMCRLSLGAGLRSGACLCGCRTGQSPGYPFARDAFGFSSLS